MSKYEALEILKVCFWNNHQALCFDVCMCEEIWRKIEGVLYV